MKKLVLLITILFVSVLSTACINNFAVQELNNKAKESLQKGDSETAICRLKSSLDLDSNMYETHYNLAVAYISAKEYKEAIKSLNKVLELNPKFIDAYYSIGIANEEIAYELIDGDDDDEDSSNDKQELSDEDKQEICDRITQAIENYNTYLTKKANAQDQEDVNDRIDVLNNELRKYNLSDDESSQET